MTDSNYIMGGLAAAVALILIAAVLWVRHRRHRAADDDYVMDGHDFEYYCADLLRHSGFQDVQVTRSSGDFGADILAEKDGVTYAVQCKCYEGAVGVEAIQEVYAGKAFYDCMVGAVMTNQYFTEPAVTLATKLNVLLWDRGYISGMLDG